MTRDGVLHKSVISTITDDYGTLDSVVQRTGHAPTGFSYQATFFWLMLCIAGFSVRSDNLSFTSIVRALSLEESRYYNLLRCFHSSAIKLPRLSQIWVQAVLTLFLGIASAE